MGADHRTKLFGSNTMEFTHFIISIAFILQPFQHLWYFSELVETWNIENCCSSFGKLGTVTVELRSGAIRSSDLQSQVWELISGGAWASSYPKRIS